MKQILRGGTVVTGSGSFRADVQAAFCFPDLSMPIPILTCMWREQ